MRLEVLSSVEELEKLLSEHQIIDEEEYYKDMLEDLQEELQSASEEELNEELKDTYKLIDEDNQFICLISYYIWEKGILKKYKYIVEDNLSLFSDYRGIFDEKMLYRKIFENYPDVKYIQVNVDSREDNNIKKKLQQGFVDKGKVEKIGDFREKILRLYRNAL